MSKIYDCITFYNENDLANLRIELLYDYVDYIIICEACYDHSGNKKKINFKLKNKKFKKKIIHLIYKKKFPTNSDSWDKERLQREYLLKILNKRCNSDDLVMYSDSDEIVNPKKLKSINLKEKFGIFMQLGFSYKFNLINKNDSPWPGTRICKFRNLKSINFLRKKIWPKNVGYSWWRLDKEKSVQLIKNGGWHFQNFYKPNLISKKLKTYPHKDEFSGKNFSSIKSINRALENQKDIFKGKNLLEKNIQKIFPFFVTKLIKKNFSRYFYEK